MRRSVLLLAFLCGAVVVSLAAKSQSYVESISDPKEWKKLLRTRTNILVLYSRGKVKQEINNIFTEVSRELRGTATLVHIDCAGDGKKLCKKNKVEPSTYVLKHYKDGDFHKDYDRRETVQSMSTFLRDPSGDIPWDEDEQGVDVVHINDMNALNKLLKKEKAFMMMFYAPWCGFCKRLKPDYSAAAAELKDTHTLVAMDVNKPENSAARIKYNITGFPTLVYFEAGAPKYTYEGENNKAGIVSFMKNPGKAPEKPKEEVWSETPSDVSHLTDATFHEFIKGEASVLVMFYAPWCGHCKRMKPEYTAAATVLKEKGIPGKLAAVDATKETKLGAEFSVKGYPTIKYFKDGEYAFDVSSAREKDKIIEFMSDPKEPPPPPPPEKPWSEVESSVIHLTDENFKPFLKKKKHVLVMFYAPWCGHCKKAKPEFTAAADKFVDDPKVEFAAVDCTAHQTLCGVNDVSGYPTFKYFNYYKNTKPYNGGRTEIDFVKFMEDPENPLSGSPPPPPSPQEEWASVEGSELLHHLTEATFDAFIKDREALVMFYAPWCGHCKAMKGDYGQAAVELAAEGQNGVLATVDATVERSLASRFQIRGFPTLKFFRRGQLVTEYNRSRKAADIIDFMRHPPLDGKDEL
nr:protein disulfide-isomerase A5-like [Penaeus vannamei]